MDSLISILIVILPSLFVIWSTNSDKQASKSETIATEQLDKVYLPIHKLLSEFTPTTKSNYVEIINIIADTFDEEYILIDYVSKKKFEKFKKSLASDNLFTISLAYKDFYRAFDYYYNSLKKQLCYPYRYDFMSIKYHFSNNITFRNKMIRIIILGIAAVAITLCYVFEISNNELVFREPNTNDTLSFWGALCIMNIILFFWNKSKR